MRPQGSFIAAALGFLFLAPTLYAQTCPSTACTFQNQAVDCNDNRYCTSDLCIGGSCFCIHNDDQCQDGDFCNGEEFCDPNVGSTGGQPGSCQPGTPEDCPKRCQGGTNHYQACTTDGNCGGGICKGICSGGTTPNISCATNGDCAGGGVCEGLCSDLHNGCVQCDTGSQCTTSPRFLCDMGECVQCTHLSHCQDGAYCNGVESCCIDGTEPNCTGATNLCAPGNPVSCPPKTCFLGNTPGATCTSDSECGFGGNCVGECSDNQSACVQCDSDSDCDNGLWCDGAETCGNFCSNNGNPCFSPGDCPGGTCVEDICKAGTAPICKTCVGGPDNGRGCASNITCPPSNPNCCAAPGTCTGTPPGSGSHCDEANDRCQECITVGQCDDNLFCTADDCTLLGQTRRCNNLEDDGLCDNGIVCDGDEACNLDLTGCVSGPPPTCPLTCFRGATPGAACANDAQCGKACLGTSPLVTCTTDSNCPRVCQGGENDGLPCCKQVDCEDLDGENDGVCLQTVCVPGLCRGLCTEAVQGGCAQCEPLGGSCDNGLFCDGTETCTATGNCAAGTPPNCDSFGTCECTQGACNEATNQCAALAINNGEFCSTGDHCIVSAECASGACVNDPPASNDLVRCGRLEFRPGTQQMLTVGSTAVLSVYLVADGCSTKRCAGGTNQGRACVAPADCPGSTCSDGTAECPSNQVPVFGLEAILQWDPTYMQLQPPATGNPNPADPCNNSNACNQCQTCVGGSNPNAPCNSRCVNGPYHGYPCFTATQCPGGTCYAGPVCYGGTDDGEMCTSNPQCGGRYCFGGGDNGDVCTSGADCDSGNCQPAFCDMTSKCLGGGTCGPSSLFNWSSSVFPNDCVSSAMNGPCPSTGFPGNDGLAYYQANQPPTCGGVHNYPARSACVDPDGLHITDIKFKALAVTPGTSTTPISFVSCGTLPRRTGITGIMTPPPNYATDDVLKSIGPSTLIRVVACDDNGDCNDGDGCTVDTCSNGSCTHSLNLCNDQNACTVDSCSGGTCHNDPLCQAPQICYVGTCYDPCSNPSQCDDLVDCTVDTCDTSPPPPIDGVCRNTPDDSLCPDTFCAGKKCDVEFGCVLDHKCVTSPDPATGNPCPDPATCDQGVPGTCGGCFSATISPLSSRYLRVVPTDQGSTKVAFLVAGDCDDNNAACVRSYVQSRCIGGSRNGLACDCDSGCAPLDCPKTCSGGTNNGNSCASDSNCPPLGVGKCLGRCETGTLGPIAHFKTAAQWGSVIKVRGAQVRPKTKYFVHTECDFAGPNVLSAAGSATSWKWGDVDGDGDADGIDVTGLVNAFRHLAGAPPYEQANIWGKGTTPCIPDDSGDVDAIDIAVGVDAFRGIGFLCAAACP